MLTGDAERRSYDGTPQQAAIHHVCLGLPREDPNSRSIGLPKVNCPDGIRAELYFPSCWDGVNTDSKDHRSHVAYPVGQNYDNGQCPDSHPNPMISIFYEFIFGGNDFKNMWYGDKQPFVYSSGDDTGFGLHGDFVNGWDEAILQNGIDKKNTDDAGCARNVECNGIFQKPDFYGEQCSLPPLLSEKVNGLLPALPGCNPIHNGPIEKQDCGTTKTLKIATDQIYTDVTKSGWSYAGCGADEYNNRVLPTQIASTDSMTVESCVQKCNNAGYTIAGLEWGRECWCGKTIAAKGNPRAGVVGDCSKPCTGNSNQKCGNGGALSLYFKCSGSSCENAKYDLVGQIGPLGDGSSSSGGSTSTTPPTPSSTPASSVTQKQGNATSAPSSSQGGASSTRTSTSSSTSSKIQATPTSSPPASSDNVKLPTGWKQSGCMTDNGDDRALKGINLAWWGEPITASNCADYCNKKGFKISGVEYGQQCFCGNKLEGGSTTAANGACNMPCAGDAKQICGGKLALNISMKTDVKRRWVG